MMRRRELLTGAAALAAYGGLPRRADAAMNYGTRRALLSNGGVKILPMPKLAAGLAARAAGTRNARVLCAGHSGVAGQGAGGNGQFSNAASFSWPTILSGLLPTGSWQSRVGDQNINNGGAGANLDAYDSRTVHGGWSFLRTNTLAGPGCAFFQGFGAATFAFTPTIPCDTFEFHAAAGSGGTPTVNINLDGGANTLCTLNGAARILVTPITGSLATHAFNAVWASGSVFWDKIIAYNSAAKETTVLNAGWCGALTADIVANASVTGLVGPTGFIATWLPDLVIIQCMGNDVLSGTSLSTFTTETQTIVTAAKNAGADVLLLADWPQNTLEAASAPYRAAYVSLGVTNNVNVFDGFAFFGSWALANAAGYMFDNFHLNGAGYSRWATLGIHPILTAATGGVA